MGNVILGAAMGSLGLLGLIVASRAQDDGIYVTGMIVFLFGVFFVFAMIKRNYDQAESADSEQS